MIEIYPIKTTPFSTKLLEEAINSVVSPPNRWLTPDACYIDVSSKQGQSSLKVNPPSQQH